MDNPLSLNTSDTRFFISIDRAYIDQEFVLRLMNRIRLEYLAKKSDIDASVETLGEEIKETWWQRNKDRLLKGEE